MSIWEISWKHDKKENENKKVDIVIVGAGMTGLTTAYMLENKDICVVDASSIGHGVTLNTTAKINYFQQRNYTKIKKLVNEKTAKLYLKSQLDSIQTLKKIIEQEKIDCDFKKVPSYVFANTKKEIKPLQEEAKFLKKQGISIQKKELPDNIFSYLSYSVNDTYTFHPLKYLKGISQILQKRKVPVYENTQVIKIEKGKDGYRLLLNNGILEAKTIVFACHYPFFLLPFFLPIKSYIEKSYIIVSKSSTKEDYTYISSSDPTYSARFYESGKKKYQISLGESHNSAFRQNDKYHFQQIKKTFGLKEKDIIMEYSNVDIMTSDLIPYIGKIDQNMYLATGYNTWGMTNSILAASVISDQIMERKNPYSSFLNPLRKNVISYLKIPYYMVSQTKSYIGTKIKKQKLWYPDSVYFIKEGEDQLGVYIDKKGNRHIVYNRCPHLGCSLLFNEVEKTWDCPCHSSRFSIDGKCIKGPSIKDIRYKKENKTKKE